MMWGESIRIRFSQIDGLLSNISMTTPVNLASTTTVSSTRIVKMRMLTIPAVRDSSTVSARNSEITAVEKSPSDVEGMQ